MSEEINKIKLQMLSEAQDALNKKESVNKPPTLEAILATMFLNNGDNSDSAKEVNTSFIKVLASAREKGLL